MSNVKSTKVFTRYQTHLTNDDVNTAKLVKALKDGEKAIKELKEAIENQNE